MKAQIRAHEPPNKRMQLSGAARTSFPARPAVGGGQRIVEFGSRGHSARS